jgi:uncharacterized membrane protein YkoI
MNKLCFKYHKNELISMIYMKLTIASILLAAVIPIIGSEMQQPANAQITNNNTSSNQNVLGQNASGSIPSTLSQGMVSQVKTGMSNAIAIAEKTIGPNSHAVLAVLQTERGSLVYTIWIADSGFNLHRVQIDSTNGKVLSSQPLSTATRQQALLEMQRGMLAPGIGQAAPGQGGMTPGQTAPGIGQAAPGQGGMTPGIGQAAPGQGGMMTPGQTAPGIGQAAPGQGGMMAPGQASPGQGGMNGKP